MSPEQSVRAFAPASVSNVACGFDILGFAIRGPGDEIVATPDAEPGVRIASIEGDDGQLPRDAALNTAGLSAYAVIERLSPARGVRLDIKKRMPSSSGLGSSAASAVAAAVAVNALFEGGLSDEELLACALEGEAVASGGRHADNLAPCLLGGFVLVRALEPRPDVVRLPVPAGLSCAILRPHQEVATKMARAVLGDQVPLSAAITQWANVAGLVAALHSGDLELLGRSLVDVVAEPKRAPLMKGFELVKRAALEAGAIGCSLSGSGPSIFALTADEESAGRVGEGMQAALESIGESSDLYVSPVDAPGARLLEPQPAAEPGEPTSHRAVTSHC